MAKSMELGVFSQKFLKAQKLEGFELAFEPFQGKRNRRAKRSTVLIEVKPLDDMRAVQASKPVSELLDRFHTFAPETANWTQAGPNRYRLRLHDHKGRLVDETETLGVLRSLQENEHEQTIDRAHRSLLATLKEMERQLDAGDIKDLVKLILKERYGN